MNTKLRVGVLLLGIALAGCQIEGVQYNGTFPASLVQAAHATPTHHRAKAAKQTHHRRTAKAAKPTVHYHRAKTPKPVKAAQPMQTNSAAYGLTLIGEAPRLAVFQDRLRGLCEIDKVEQLTPDQWRATCAKKDAFTIKVYPDGFMTVSRANSAER